MTDDEVIEYWVPARKNFDGPGGHFDPIVGSKKLAAVLGLIYPRPNYWEEIFLTDELKFKLRLLSGPHWRTVLKIKEIRNDTR